MTHYTRGPLGIVRTEKPLSKLFPHGIVTDNLQPEIIAATKHEADARLMAAAPDLYSALSDLLSADTDELYMAAWDRAEATLARARGEEETS